MTSPAELLAQLREDPRKAAEAISRAMDGPAADAVREALRADKRFGPPLRVAIRDLDALCHNKWLVQFLGHLKYAPAVPELLAAWRSEINGLCDQAGRALIHIGDLTAVRAMAADFPDAPDRGIALRCVFATQVSPYDTIEPHVSALGPVTATVLYYLSAEPQPLADDPRWLALAARAVRDGTGLVQDAARELLLRRVAKDELHELFPGQAGGADRGEVEAAREILLAKARVAMTKLRDALPEAAWKAPPRTRRRQLDRIESAFGPLPASVRAFYELIDGITIEAAGKAKNRFIVYPLAEAIKEHRRWTKQASPKTTPAVLLPRFLFPVAPDAYTKAGMSGGPDVAFEMPTDNADPKLLHLARSPKFSTLVRRAIRKRGKP